MEKNKPSKKKKPNLPVGWIVLPSKSYPNRVYYFNFETGCSSWEIPILEYGKVNEQSVDKLQNLDSKSSCSTSGIESLTSFDTRVSQLSKSEGSRSDLQSSYKISKETLPHTTVRMSNNSNHERTVCDNKSGSCDRASRKRQWKKRASGSLDLNSDSDAEKPPSRKIKLNRSGSSQSSSDSSRNKQHRTKEIDSTSKLHVEAKNSSSHSEETYFKSDDLRHILKAKRKVSDDKCKEKQARGSAQEKTEESTNERVSSRSGSGLAAKRLEALQSHLASKRAKLEFSEEITPQKLRNEYPVKEDVCSTPKIPKTREILPHYSLPQKDTKNSAQKRLKTLVRRLSENRRSAEKSGQSTYSYNGSPQKSEALPLIEYHQPCSETSRSHIMDNMNQSANQSCLQPPVMSKESGDSFYEEMEWEPIEEEKVLSQIQEVRTKIQKDNTYSLDEKSMLKSSNFEPSYIISKDGKPEWFIVLDTNVLISNITYVAELRDTNFKGLGFPVLIIPWQVLQELDFIKDSRNSDKSKSVIARAQKAVSFLHSNFTSKHPRIRGQSVSDATDNFKIEVPDDFVLQCCLQIAHSTNRVVLFTNDKNLCNKAMVNGIKAYNRESIQRALEDLGLKELQSTKNECAVLNVDVNPDGDGASRADSILCKLKARLKDLLSVVLRNEMQKTYDNLWLSIIAVKPPWTLPEIIFCFHKHWIAVFQIVFPEEVRLILESLQKYFFYSEQSEGYGYPLPVLREILQTSHCLCMKVPLHYKDYISRCTTEIEKLQKYLEESLRLENQRAKDEDELQAVINLLEGYWKYVCEFCAVMCDLLGFKHNLVYDRPESFPTLNDIRNRLPAMYPEVRMLVKNMTSVLEVPLRSLTTSHEAVRNLYFTITNLYPSEQAEETFTPEHVLKLCTIQRTRMALEQARSLFEEAEVIMDRAVHYFVQSQAS